MHVLPLLRHETTAMRLAFEERSHEASAAYERRMVERAEHEADCVKGRAPRATGRRSWQSGKGARGYAINSQTI